MPKNTAQGGFDKGPIFKISKIDNWPNPRLSPSIGSLIGMFDMNVKEKNHILLFKEDDPFNINHFAHELSGGIFLSTISDKPKYSYCLLKFFQQLLASQLKIR